ncbi:ABC transporter ATP-binding protein [Haloparvum alkalitolerans]|uniref:ABC transporter ATP-binding protein n=1 Tax=Haloparvum alkalitolerans TaxID=1042953 RepID=UPI003CF4CAC9
MSLLELDDVHAYYGQSHVLQGVSLDVEEGEVVALIGRNGVGKTTTLRSILGLTPPREGTVRFRGEDVTGEETHEIARRGVGWVPEERRMFTHLTVDENIRIATPEPAGVPEAFETAYSTFPELEEHRGKEAGDLSGGQQQMVAIARGLVGDNDLLLVDEPSEGLAPLIVEAVADAIRTVSEETTVLLVEQNFPLATELADRYYLLDHGTVVDAGSTEGVSRDDETIRRYLSA